MTKSLATALLVGLASTPTVYGFPIFAWITPVDTDVPTFDPGILATGPNVDVWHVSLSNPTASDVTLLKLELWGPWQNFQQGGRAFNDTTDLPTFGPNTVAESFFPLPSGTTPLSVDTIDNGTLLASTYTVAGDTALVPAGGSAVVAVLTTPAGEVSDPRFSGMRRWTGRAAAGGKFFSIDFYAPEPASAMLAGVSVVVAAAGRRRTLK